MPLWIAGAAVLGSVLSSRGTSQTNQANMDISTQNNAFNAEQAEANRTFQAGQADMNRAYQTGSVQNAQDYATGMSNTSYQRAVKDMQAAGLNPMLAYSHGGSSTPQGMTQSGSMPGGSQASSAGLPHMSNPYANVATAQQMASVKEALARTEKTEAETDLIRSHGAPEKEADMAHKNAIVREINQKVGRDIEGMSLSDWERALKRIQHYKTGQEAGITEAENRFATKYFEARSRGLSHEATLSGLEIPGASNVAEHQRKYPGYNINVRPFIGDATDIGNSASTINRSFRGLKWQK